MFVPLKSAENGIQPCRKWQPPFLISRVWGQKKSLPPYSAVLSRQDAAAYSKHPNVSTAWSSLLSRYVLIRSHSNFVKSTSILITSEAIQPDHYFFSININTVWTVDQISNVDDPFRNWIHQISCFFYQMIAVTQLHRNHYLCFIKTDWTVDQTTNATPHLDRWYIRQVATCHS